MLFILKYEFVCEYCGKKFLNHHKDARFCCRSCSYKSRYKNNIDKNVYENGWNSDNAYLFGLIMSDGCLTKNKKRNIIVISLNDFEIIEKLYKYVECKRKIYKQGKQSKLYYWNEGAVSFLKKYNLEQRKSLTIKYPDLPYKYNSDFIRGYFDGDGSIVFNKRKENTYPSVSITCGNVNFLSSLKNILEKENIKSGIYKDNRSESNYLKVKSIKDCKKFYNYIYGNNPTFYLQRKKDKFDYINNIEYKYKGMI